MYVKKDGQENFAKLRIQVCRTILNIIKIRFNLDIKLFTIWLFSLFIFVISLSSYKIYMFAGSFELVIIFNISFMSYRLAISTNESNSYKNLRFIILEREISYFGKVREALFLSNIQSFTLFILLSHEYRKGEGLILACVFSTFNWLTVTWKCFL